MQQTAKQTRQTPQFIANKKERLSTGILTEYVLLIIFLNKFCVVFLFE